jgi:serine/threonine-protein kinase
MSKTGDSGETTTFQSGPHPMPDLDDAQAALPVIDLGKRSTEFELGETLGEGGMGQVVSARQKTLQRSVAIKFLKEAGGDATVLLREAIATGRLEHPNIVPVHLLAKTTEGVPFFTMKRVEGTPWSDALRSGRTLVEHLEILQRVCDAVAFAHSRGVVHRDLKPANVLIGAFGEVYLVDWGLAASLRDDSVLPLVSDASVGGTPAYLAPEAALDTGKLGPWTDVFLLGATLYEVVMGRPPWVAGSVSETIALAAAAAEPPFDPKVPTELANLCRRAMKKEPHERLPSARAFRDALTDYLHHHHAFELHERTMGKLAELERATAGASAAGSIERLFTECRFGFEQVQQSWPDFEPARTALRRALVLMVRHELSRNAVTSARALLSELVQPPVELVLQVEDAERAEREKAERLLALEQQAKDLSTDSARDLKASYVRIVAFGSILFSAGLQGLATTGVINPVTNHGLIFSVLLVVNSLLYAGWLRRQAEANQMQRRLAIALIGLSVVSGLAWWVAWLDGIGLHAALLAFYLVNAGGWWTAAVAIEPRGTVVAVGFALSAALGMLFPPFAIGCGVCIGLSMWLLSSLLRTAGPSSTSAWGPVSPSMSRRDRP